VGWWIERVIASRSQLAGLRAPPMFDGPRHTHDIPAELVWAWAGAELRLGQSAARVGVVASFPAGPTNTHAASNDRQAARRARPTRVRRWIKRCNSSPARSPFPTAAARARLAPSLRQPSAARARHAPGLARHLPPPASPIAPSPTFAARRLRTGHGGLAGRRSIKRADGAFAPRGVARCGAFRALALRWCRLRSGACPFAFFLVVSGRTRTRRGQSVCPEFPVWVRTRPGTAAFAVAKCN
jgi:hypothetical protein